jgi:nicotinate-nucleotide pyrophosphorylase (carboxylating)
MKNYYRYINWTNVDKIIKNAILEDAGNGDVTSELLIDKKEKSSADLLLKEKSVIAGLRIYKRVFELIDPEIKIKLFAHDGALYNKDKILARLKGSTRNILLGERVSLNILQRMSGIANEVSYFVKRLNKSGIKLLDTRKTTPNIRLLEKLAVKIGGGINHRFGLYDMILIKDNHIEANGTIYDTLKLLVKKRRNIKCKVEIEVKNLNELLIVLKFGKGLVDIVMLDNFLVPDIKKAIKLNNKVFKLEISGGINRMNISRYENLKGLDFISSGSVTHSVKSTDISLNFKK